MDNGRSEDSERRGLSTAIGFSPVATVACSRPERRQQAAPRISYSYQWQDNGKNIAGATASPST